MKKVLVWSLVCLSIIAVMLRFSSKWTELIFGIKETSGISVLSEPAGATVYLNSKEVGKTPYEDKNLNTEEYIVKIEKEKAFWQGKAVLVSGVVTVVSRDLALDQASGAGEILTLDKGKGLTVVSSPTNAVVGIDGKVYGKTPLTANIEAGEYTVLISHPNYLKRSIRVNLPPNYNLTISSDLALSEADLTAITSPVINKTLEVLVKNTPTGFLRVREKPGLSGKEITQVKPGDVLVFLEETEGWSRIRLPEGTEGYVSSVYVEKKSP